MTSYKEDKNEELEYLNGTLNFIKKELFKEQQNLKVDLGSLIASRKEMWEDTVHFSNDFDRIPEMNQYLLEANSKGRNYNNTLKQIERYKKMMNSPYFGRFDFREEAFDEVEKIYVGLYNLMDSENESIIVYDWRAPISSIFYRCEIGKGEYKSPVGMISGDILMKRQYKIHNSQLKFFFDSSVKINDEILQEVLSLNSSSKMKNIVQTIQKEQDIIIRDTESDLLIVQGTAGSGKTSIALHRIAFLLYEGLDSKISHNNVIIISPNSVFSNYISEVIPELGEEEVEQITFDQIVSKLLKKENLIETREQQLEQLISLQNYSSTSLKMDSIKFKGSNVFKEILQRFIKYYEHSLIDFKDVYYNGEIIDTREILKNLFLNNKIGMPIAKRLKRIENMILNKVYPLRKKRLIKIKNIVKDSDDHIFEINSFSRLLSIKESKVFMKHIGSFTKVDYMDLYKMLFNKEGLILKLSKGLQLPHNIEDIISETRKCLYKDYICYEDCAPLLYIKLILEGNNEFSEIKQVVIDEAQDYYALQYEVFKLLFKGARYTVLGDFNQTLERGGNKSMYDEIDKILNKRKTVKLFMNKSYRCSFEINLFTQKLLSEKQKVVPFERHGEKPMIVYKDTRELMDKSIADQINYYNDKGYEAAAVICKTQKEADKVYESLKNITKINILRSGDEEVPKGNLIIPSYLAKGLEFDTVFVYNVSRDNYRSEFDKKLLYIACTRALHQLNIYYTGEGSKFIKS